MSSEPSVEFFLMHPFPIVHMPKTLSFVIASVSLFVLGACTTNVPTPVDQTTSSSASAMEQSSIFLEQSSVSSDGGVILDIPVSSSVAMQPSSVAASKASAIRTVIIHVSSFAFTPGVITAKQGEKVRVQLIGDSGIHGFAVPGLGINVRVEAGQSVTVDLPTDLAGHFDVFCSIPCGPGHQSMKATVVIQ